MSEQFLKLLTESSTQIEVLTENTENGKKLFIEGIFCQAEVINGNKRFYPKSIMESAVGNYVTDYVDKRRAIGELNHPDYPFPNIQEAAILIKELRFVNEKDVYGKAEVLDTPKGLIIKGLLNAGFNMGVSTRGLGSIKEKQGIKYVQDNFMLSAVDCVDQPSGPNCYVNPVLESTVSWVKQNGIWIQAESKEELNNNTIRQFDESIFLQKLEDYIKCL